MKMIRQYDNRVSREGMALPCLTKRSAQFIDVLRQQFRFALPVLRRGYRYPFGASANAAKIRAHERMPL